MKQYLQKIDMEKELGIKSSTLNNEIYNRHEIA